MSSTAQAQAPPAEAPSPAVTPSSGEPRYPLLDAMRGVAVLAVVAFHVAGITGALGSRVAGSMLAVVGNLGVVLFFVVSAFLLYRPFARAHAEGWPHPGVRRFLRRRALRILPAYWVALTLLAIFPGVVGVFTGDWWRFYLFTQLYFEDSVGAGIPPAWTLCVEVTFYAALPLWALAVRGVRLGGGRRAWLRAELVPLALVAAVGVGVQVLARRLEIDRLVGDSLLGQAPWFALGMALAVYAVAVERGMREARPARLAAARPGLCWLLALGTWALLAEVQHAPGGLLGIVQRLSTPQPAAETVLLAALTGATVLLVLAPALFGSPAQGALRRALGTRPVVWLGVVSYAVYLYHLPVAQVLGLRADPAHISATGLNLVERLPFAVTPLLFLATLAVTCAVAAASYRWVELPFLRHK